VGHHRCLPGTRQCRRRNAAPGISEALITTAAGLFTAIPAVIAYNFFMQQLREFGARMDDFGLEFLNAVERPAAPARPRETAVLEER
jgi:biopolymer transport protein TolQ